MSQVNFAQVRTDVYRIDGKLTYSTVSSVMNKGLIAFDQSAKCQIDLAGVTQADSAGLSLIVEWVKYAKSKNITLDFVNVPEQMKALSKVNGLEFMI